MESILPFLLGLSTIILWGIADFLIVLAVRKQSSATILLWSQIIGTILFFLYFMWAKNPIHLSPALWMMVILAGILNMIAYASFYEGLLKAPVAIVSPLGSCAAIVTVILGVMVLGESLTSLQIFGVVLAIGGASLSSINFKGLKGKGKLSLQKGAVYGLISLLCWGLVFALFDVMVESMGWAQSQLLIKAFLILPLLGFIMMRSQPLFPEIREKYFFLFLALIGILDILGAIAYSKSVSLEYTSIMFPFISAFPIVTIILARIFLKERVEWVQYLGAALALFGIVLLAL